MNFLNQPSSNDQVTTQRGSFDILMNRYLPEEFRTFIEENFYQKVSDQATLESIKEDPAFLKKPATHIALFTDHGVVHVRDVALQVLDVIERVNGVLIPYRDRNELEFLKGYSLLLVYLHDIGMSDFTSSGRFMHPEFAAQFAFTPEFDEMIELLWSKNAGNIPWIISSQFKDQTEDRLKVILREIMSLSVGHSKSKLPMTLLNDPSSMRRHMIDILSKPLKLLLYDQKVAKLTKTNTDKKKSVEQKIDGFKKKKTEYIESKNILVNEDFTRFYENADQEAFSWLEQSSNDFRRFIINIQDSIRCIRAADALRQRGTVLRTSAGYEIFADRKTANAIYALRNEANDRLYLLESKKSVNAGEANLASSEIDPAGNLRLSFHIGSFITQKVTNKAARNAAMTLDDIQADTVQSFKRDTEYDKDIFDAPKVSFEDIRILVEFTEDNPNFSELVCDLFHKINPKESHRISGSFSLHGLDITEVERFLHGESLEEHTGQEEFRNILFQRLKERGYLFDEKKPIPGEEDIKVLHLAAGEQLIQAGSKSGFVYFPMSDGLRVHPLGGYESSQAAAWVPLGNTGVIRGSTRNAHVFSEKPVSLICVPKNIYLDHWYHPISPKELKEKGIG